MAIKNRAITANYTAWDTSSNVGKTGDAANHNLFVVLDGSISATNNSGAEVSATACAGLYKVALDAAETNGNAYTVCGNSNTGNISIIPTTYTTERGKVADILTDTSAVDSTSKMRTFLTGANTAVCKDSTPLTAAETEAECEDAIQFNTGSTTFTVSAGSSGTSVKADAVEGGGFSYTNDKIFANALFVGLGQNNTAWQSRVVSNTYVGGVWTFILEKTPPSTPQDGDTFLLIPQLWSSNVQAVHTDTSAASNLELDYDSTGYAKSNSTMGTVTTNTDVRGTDSAHTAASARAVLGVPTNIDGGGATISGNLRKFADDSSGSGFDAATDSLQKIRDRGDSAWESGTADSANVIATRVWASTTRNLTTPRIE